MGTIPYSYRSDASVPKFPDDKPILVFDGHCALCSATVQFILRHDGARDMHFIIAQSPLGEALYRHYGFKHADYDTNILLEGGEALVKSDSSIRIFEIVGPPWSLLRLARVVPRALRDPLYEFIARNRLKWFGAKANCYLPDAATRARFIG